MNTAYDTFSSYDALLLNMAGVFCSGGEGDLQSQLEVVVKKILLSIAAMSALSFVAGGRAAFADSPATPAGTLAGVSSVMVSVQQGTSELDGQGMSAADLTKLVTDQLSAGGIKVVTPASADGKSGGLEVSVSAIKPSGQDAYAISLLLAFHQGSKLMRNSSILADAITWRRMELAYVPAASIGDFKSTITADVGDFVTDYKSSNKSASNRTPNGDMTGTGAEVQHAPVAPNRPN